MLKSSYFEERCLVLEFGDILLSSSPYILYDFLDLVGPSRVTLRGFFIPKYFSYLLTYPLCKLLTDFSQKTNSRQGTLFLNIMISDRYVIAPVQSFLQYHTNCLIPCFVGLYIFSIFYPKKYWRGNVMCGARSLTLTMISFLTSYSFMRQIYFSTPSGCTPVILRYYCGDTIEFPLK